MSCPQGEAGEKIKNMNEYRPLSLHCFHRPIIRNLIEIHGYSGIKEGGMQVVGLNIRYTVTIIVISFILVHFLYSGFSS